MLSNVGGRHQSTNLESADRRTGEIVPIMQGNWPRLTSSMIGERERGKRKGIVLAKYSEKKFGKKRKEFEAEEVQQILAHHP
jgi:hypothetical protein